MEENTNKQSCQFVKQNDFSLVQGGPLFRLLVGVRLSTANLDFVKRRVVAVCMFAWLPLAVLSFIDGTAWGNVGLPFLRDLEMQTRFLVALPLLIAAEFHVHQRMHLIVGQFIDRDIITAQMLPRFNAITASTMKLRNSVVMETILFALIYFGGYFLWSSISGLARIGDGSGTWFGILTDSGIKLSPAGYWYVFVSRPVFQFLILRWYFRLFIWARFLWKSSRLELNLIPTHPDRAAGLGFLAASGAVFAPLLMAHGALLAGLMADQIIFTRASLPDFKMEILGSVVFLLLLVLAPLLVFSPQLLRAKRTGLREYGMFASRYITEFDLKWIRGGAAADEELIGSGDIQSLADLGNSFQVVRDIQPFPFGKSTVIQLAVFILLPVLPLVFTMIPLEELIRKLIGTVL